MSDPETNNDLDEDREEQYDLLTAALLGAAVGAVITLLFRAGPGGRRPIGPVVSAAGRGARLAGVAGIAGARWAGDRAGPGARWVAEHGREGAKWARKRGARGYRVARERGEELVDSIPFDDVAESVRDYAENAREAINDAVREELSDLRKAVRRQRKRIGI